MQIDNSLGRSIPAARLAAVRAIFEFPRGTVERPLEALQIRGTWNHDGSWSGYDYQHRGWITVRP